MTIFLFFSGDGILFEVINGIFERPDWETVISEISFGIIPCGSGNGLAKSIAHSLRFVIKIYTLVPLIWIYLYLFVI